jgi:hypothetical protein
VVWLLLFRRPGPEAEPDRALQSGEARPPASKSPGFGNYQVHGLAAPRWPCFGLLGWGRSGADALLVVRVPQRGRQADALLGAGGAVEVEAGPVGDGRASLARSAERQERVIAGSAAGRVGRVSGDVKRRAGERDRGRRRCGLATRSACCLGRRRKRSRGRVGGVPETAGREVSEGQLGSGAACAEGRLQERVWGATETPSEETVCAGWLAGSYWQGGSGRRACRGGGRRARRRSFRGCSIDRRRCWAGARRVGSWCRGWSRGEELISGGRRDDLRSDDLTASRRRQSLECRALPGAPQSASSLELQPECPFSPPAIGSPKIDLRPRSPTCAGKSCSLSLSEAKNDGLRNL